MHLGNTKKNEFSFGISLDLHYLCSQNQTCKDYDNSRVECADMARHGRDSRQRAVDEAVGKVSEEVGGQKGRSNADDERGVLCQGGQVAGTGSTGTCTQD